MNILVIGRASIVCSVRVASPIWYRCRERLLCILESYGCSVVSNSILSLHLTELRNFKVILDPNDPAVEAPPAIARKRAKKSGCGDNPQTAAGADVFLPGLKSSIE